MTTPLSTSNLQSISVDNLAFIVNMKSGHETKVVARITQKFKDIRDTRRGFYDPLPGYATGVRIPLSADGIPYLKDATSRKDDPYLKIHLAMVRKPQGSKKNHVRFKFNPSRFNVKGLLQVRAIIEEIAQQDYGRFISQAAITEIDLAFDFKNVSMNDFVFAMPRKRKWQIYGKGDSIETIVLGATKTKERVRVYDKSNQLLQTGKGSGKGAIVRVEHCFRPANDKVRKRQTNATQPGAYDKLRLWNIPTMLREIHSLRIYDFAALRKDPDLPHNFSDSCRLRTVNGALATLDNGTAKRVRKILERSRIDYLGDMAALRKLLSQHLVTDLLPLKPPKPTPKKP